MSERNKSNNRRALPVALLVASASTIIVASLAAFALLPNDDSGPRDAVHYGGEVRDGLVLYAVVDGVEITDAHWTYARLKMEQSMAYLSSEVERDDVLSEVSEANIQLIEHHGFETAVFAGLLVNAALLAEVERRGLNPSPDEIAAEVDRIRAEIEQLRRQSEGGDAELSETVRQIDVLLDALTEPVYWGVLQPEEVHREMGAGLIREQVMQQTIDDGQTPEEARRAWADYCLGLLRDAHVEVLGGPPLELSRESALEYLGDFYRLQFFDPLRRDDPKSPRRLAHGRLRRGPGGRTQRLEGARRHRGDGCGPRLIARRGAWLLSSSGASDVGTSSPDYHQICFVNLPSPLPSGAKVLRFEGSSVRRRRAVTPPRAPAARS